MRTPQRRGGAFAFGHQGAWPLDRIDLESRGVDRLCPLGGGMIFSVSGPGVLQAAQGRLDERSRRILVLAVQSGPASVLANNGPLPLTAGSILLAHSELPLEVRSDEGSELVGFAAPAHFFSPRFVPIERIRGGALIPLEGAIAHLMSQLMASLVAPDRAIRDADAAVDAIGGLLAALTQNRWASEPKLRSVSRREARVEQIAVFIRRRFADPDLSPSTVADALGISPRYIHKVYSKNGRTFRSIHQLKVGFERTREKLARTIQLLLHEKTFRRGNFPRCSAAPPLRRCRRSINFRPFAELHHQRSRRDQTR